MFMWTKYIDTSKFLAVPAVPCRLNAASAMLFSTESNSSEHANKNSYARRNNSNRDYNNNNNRNNDYKPRNRDAQRGNQVQEQVEAANEKPIVKCN